jgi:serine/threonine-protein kinase
MISANWSTQVLMGGPLGGTAAAAAAPVRTATRDHTIIGSRIGAYLITKRLGAGGVGEVFKGVDTMLKREVAIKVLRDELASDPLFLERFSREAQLHAQLSHANVAAVHAFLHEGDKQVMVMEYVAGVSLDEFVRSGGPVPVPRALGIFRRALDGIAHAHDCGIVHRDIKPANIMLADNGQVKVMDFGIARAMDSQEHLTRHGQVVGTAKAMAPEQIRGAQADVRSDIYSLGIVLYTMLAGRAPFDGDNDHALMIAQLQQAPAPLHDHVADLPPALEGAVMRALQKDPAARFPSVREFAAAIDACLADAAAALPPTTSGFDEATSSRTVINPVVHGVERLPSAAGRRPRFVRPRWLTPGVAAGVPVLVALVASGVLLLADHEPVEGVGVAPPVVTAVPTVASQAAVEAAPVTPRPAPEPAYPTLAADAAVDVQTVALQQPEALPAVVVPALVEGAMPRTRLAILREPAAGVLDDAQVDAALAGDDGAIQRYRAGERIRLQVATSADAHVYCYLQDESRQILRIYPNRFSPDSRVAARQPLSIPGRMRFELVANRKKTLETVACFAAERDLIAELSAAVVGAEFERLPVVSLDDVARAFARVAPERMAQARFRVQPR